jgi:glycerate dehydrogenase
MPLMNIVFLDQGTFSPETTLRHFSFAHQLTVHTETSADEVASRIADADVVIINKVRLTAEIIAKAPRLKLVAVAATGTDNIDLAACAAQQVVVSNIRNYAVNTVPEHTLALIFSLRRSITAYVDSVKAGRWQESEQFCYFDHPIRDLAGSTLGIIGDGVLGQSVASLGRALGMRVIFSGFKGRTGQGALYTPFEETLEQSDVLTLHCPLNASTKNMIGRTEFSLMKKRPLLINTARGGLVDETAVEEALDQGWISGAAFDVLTVEPPPANHPFMKLINRPNFILTPHVAWASQEAIQGLADQLVDNIEAFFAGKPRNVVSA